MTALRVLLGAALAAVATIVGLVLLAGGMVIGTPAGARWALRLAAPAVPGELSVAGVEGSLATAIELRGVRYAAEALQVELRALEIDLDWGALARGRLVLTRLGARDGAIELIASTDDEPGGAPPRLPRIPESVAVTELEVSGVELRGLPAPARIERLAGRLEGPRLEIDTVALAAAGSSIAGAGDVALEAGRASGAVSGTVTLPAAAPGAPPAALELTGTFELVTDAEPWYAAFEWTRAEWRGPPLGQASSPMGRVVVRPGTEPMQIGVRARLEAAALPGGAAELDADAGLIDGGLEVSRLDAAVLGGQIRARGAWSFAPPSGFASVDFDGLDPAVLDPRVAGLLEGEVDVALATEPELVVTVAGDVGGRLGERPLTGQIAASYVAGALHVERGDLSLGEGRLTLAGTLSENFADLALTAWLPELGHWYPPASGTVTAAGTIGGDPSNPSVDLELAAEGLALADSPLPRIAELTLAVAGARDSHRVRLAARTDVGRFSVATEQSVRNERFTGTLLEAVLAFEQFGTWRLDAPADFTVAGADFTVEDACFVGPQRGELCAGTRARAAALTARNLPNDLAEPWLPEGIRIAGAADADVEIDWSGPLAGSFELRQPMLRVTAAARPAQDEPPAPASGQGLPAGVAAEIEDILLSGSLAEDAFRARLSASLAATGDPIRGEIALAPPSAAGQLDGRVTARLTELAVIDALVEGVESLSGQLDLAATVAGTLQDPVVRGAISAQSLQAALPPLGIEVTEGRLMADARGLDAVTFAGGLCSDGCVRFDGALELRQADPWRLEARLTGERFELADVPDLRVVVSPDLTLQADPEAWQVAGELGIPEGAIEIEDVPRSAVRPAPETVVHGRPEPPAEDAALPIPLAVEVTALLGDVRFRGLGIEAELDGALDVERTLNGMILVQGTTAIEEGTFTAYAQTLTIERGLLIFTGPPDNPALDIRATRMVEGATVGLNITGSARNPRSVVFSEPALPESEAFARLLTGRSLADAGGADPEALEQAALGLGLRRALPTLNRFGQNLGLDELSVESGGNVDGGALVAGKRLGEDIVLRYRHGLFDEFSGLELIYQITERFRLRTETGTTQSIDLIYEVGRGAGSGLDAPNPGGVAVEEQAATPAEVVQPGLPTS